MKKEEAEQILNKIVDKFWNLDVEVRQELVDYFCAHYGWVRPG